MHTCIPKHIHNFNCPKVFKKSLKYVEQICQFRRFFLEKLNKCLLSCEENLQLI